MRPGVAYHDVVAHAGGISRTPATEFDSIYTVFLLLGTLVGVVVIGYTLYNALKYRDDGERTGDTGKKVVRPELGEIPGSSGGGKKLFVSFGISAVIVISLILWTYSSLLYVDAGAASKVDEPDEVSSIEGVNDEGVLVIDVVGQQFSWVFVYPNGHRNTTLTVPNGTAVKLNVTSDDVMHNIGIPAFNAKTDAIPGQTTTAWFVPDETGTFKANCYELCGSGHSVMVSDVVVREPSAYNDWYANTEEASADDSSDETEGNETDGNESGDVAGQQDVSVRPSATSVLAGGGAVHAGGVP